MTKYYVDENGNYLGGFDGVVPPMGAVEVANPPEHGLDKYIEGAWVDGVSYAQKRKESYPMIGDQLDAIWKELKSMRDGGAVLSASTNDMLDDILAIKANYPKPE